MKRKEKYNMIMEVIRVYLRLLARAENKDNQIFKDRYLVWKNRKDKKKRKYYKGGWNG
jgi:type IV secretory pathway VirB3-like protein|tara:strand:+ start:30 stop:203 length:174 start_codon:yes stop_codon:yes gene_type:complete